MRIPDILRKCVCFVGYRTRDDQMLLKGTGFFVAKRLDEHIWMAYCVTAAHVLEGIHKAGSETVSIRLNRHDGGYEWVEQPLNRCHTHLDLAVDVAAIPHSGLMDFDHFPWSLERIVTKEVIDDYQVGPGDDLFMMGLFYNHHGSEKNLPIIRVGNIAAMPEEPVETARGPMEAYLVEARSVNGLSGSPVFFYGGHDRARRASSTTPAVPGALLLLGMMHGHFEVKAPLQSELDSDELTAAVHPNERVNVGIGIVVPIERVTELLNLPVLLKQEAKAVALAKEKRARETGNGRDA